MVPCLRFPSQHWSLSSWGVDSSHMTFLKLDSRHKFDVCFHKIIEDLQLNLDWNTKDIGLQSDLSLEDWKTWYCPKHKLFKNDAITLRIIPFLQPGPYIPMWWEVRITHRDENDCNWCSIGQKQYGNNWRFNCPSIQRWH